MCTSPVLEASSLRAELSVLFSALCPVSRMGPGAHTWWTRIFTDEWNLKVIGFDEAEKVVWAQALRTWFPPVASSHICSWCLVNKSSGTLCNPVDCSPPASSIHGVCQASILEWVAISFPRASSRPRDQTWASCIGRQVLYHWAMWEQSLYYNPGSYKLYILYESFQEA